MNLEKWHFCEAEEEDRTNDQYQRRNDGRSWDWRVKAVYYDRSLIVVGRGYTPAEALRDAETRVGRLNYA